MQWYTIPTPILMMAGEYLNSKLYLLSSNEYWHLSFFTKKKYWVYMYAVFSFNVSLDSDHLHTGLMDEREK
jgi:hypothetical protein